MIKGKKAILEEMKELEGIIDMYKEAFPDNPALASKKQKKAAAKQEDQKKEEQPSNEVDVSKVVYDAYQLAADVFILASIDSARPLDFGSTQHSEALKFVHSQAPSKGVFKESRVAFPETYSKLFAKSQEQVLNTGLTYEQLHEFVLTARAHKKGALLKASFTHPFLAQLAQG